VAYLERVVQNKLADSGKVQKKAVLNRDWNKAEKGWVEIQMGNEPAQKIEVAETGFFHDPGVW